MALLELQSVRAYYGTVPALHGVDLRLEEGELVAILGANGAGKSTVLRAVSRLARTEGQITFSGRSLARLTTDAVARLGISHAPEGRGTFTDLTVRENLLLGARSRRPGVPGSGSLDLERMYRLFPALEESRSRAAGALSGGQQQMLALARALIRRPRLLLVDEPSLGLAHGLARELLQKLQELRSEWGLSVLLTEQNAILALDIADRAYALESGRVRLAGTAAELRDSDLVRASYLGA